MNICTFTVGLLLAGSRLFSDVESFQTTTTTTSTRTTTTRLLLLNSRDRQRQQQGAASKNFAALASPRRTCTQQHAAVVLEEAMEVVVAAPSSTASASSSPSTGQTSFGAFPMDLNGIAFSGLKGQALSHTSFPKSAELRAAVPDECFEVDTATSLGYLSVSVIGTALCTVAGLHMLPLLNPGNPLTWPIWTVYSAVTGTVAMGLWVLAHECGHGAFSKNKALQDAVGYAIHSLFLVPYFSWQRSHAVHHQYTNHIELGETHVPETMSTNGENPSFTLRKQVLDTFGPQRGIQLWGAYQLFLHLVVGWPAYLLIGATGGHARGMTNHYYPNPLTTPDLPNKELFPGNWKEKVYQSDIGIAAVTAAVVMSTVLCGPAAVMALYGGPLLVVNAWLVLYTWLQHTDVDVPHYSNDQDYTFAQGALHSIDRPYDQLLGGVIDFLHHKIGTTHVAHHFASAIPHYKADVATQALREKFPQYCLYDPTPIPQALWRVAKGCTAVEKRGDKWVWKNEGVEYLIE